MRLEQDPKDADMLQQTRSAELSLARMGNVI